MSYSRFSSFTLSTTVQKNLKAKKSACVFCLRLGLDPGGKWVRFVVLDGQRLEVAKGLERAKSEAGTIGKQGR